MPTNPDDRVSGQPLSSNPRSPSAASFDPIDPVDSLPNLAGGGDGGLSSLAQSAREKQLKSARSTLVVIGILTILFNVGTFLVIENQIDDVIRKAGLNRNNLPVEVKMAIAVDYAITGGFVALGVIFVVLGMLVPSYPVPCTVAGLVLFVLGWLVSFMNPAMLNPIAILVKIVIIVFLAKAVQAALAYERERTQSAVEYE
jgi:hypothetical protein